MQKSGAPPALNLRLTNTLTGAREAFKPLSREGVGMYHCGPTVTEPINVDKFRSYLLGDVLRRYLEFLGLPVRQVMNITDVGHLNEFDEDAVEITAGRSGRYAGELVEEEEKIFHEDRRALNILDAHAYPRAREHVQEMIAFIQGLLAAGAAYREGGNVYFDAGRSPVGGRLHRFAPAGASEPPAAADRGAARKRNPQDFDLWRADPIHQMHWLSPWGRGFPGWHVECVVMGRKYLGPTFDIHSGSEENIHPHHECEIAQAEAAGGGPLARTWLHSRHVLLEGKPVSRANRNLITVRGLRGSGVPGPEIRGALLSARFRDPLEFRPELIDAAHEALTALRTFRDRHRETSRAAAPAPDALRKRLAQADGEFRAALDEDLDFPAALRAVLRLVRDLDPASTPPSSAAAEAIDRFDRVLGFL